MYFCTMTENQLKNICNFSFIFLSLNIYKESDIYILGKWKAIIDDGDRIIVDDKNNPIIYEEDIVPHYMFGSVDLDSKFISIFSLLSDIKELYRDVKFTRRPFTLDNLLEIYRKYIDIELVNNHYTDFVIHANLLQSRNEWLEFPINSRTYTLELFTD